MEIVVEAYNFDHARWCIENNVPNLVLGYELFANRLSYSFNQSEIQDLVNKRKNTKIWVKVNNFFFEHELNRLEMYLRWLSNLDIDRIVFQDFAVAQIDYEDNLNLKLHYNPETLITNYGQFDFYLENKINSCFLARELMPHEIQDIAQHKNKMQVEVQGFGYGFIMHSRWKLISNFEEHYQVSLNKEYLKIKEALRKHPNVIFEDAAGTHMLTGYLIDSLYALPQLINWGVDYLSLNFIKTNEDIAKQVTTLFSQAIVDTNLETSLNKYSKQLQTICEGHMLSPGFLGGPKTIPHTQKVDDEK